MSTLEVLVALGAAILTGGLLARRLHIASAVVLLAIGVLLGLVPALGQVQLPPEVMLLPFLPVLLYRESLTTPAREIRTYLRAIIRSSTSARWHRGDATYRSLVATAA